MPPSPAKKSNGGDNDQPEQPHPAETQLTGYVSAYEHQQILRRLEQLEKAGLGQSPVSNGSDSSVNDPVNSPASEDKTRDDELKKTVTDSEQETSVAWQEIFALQEAVKRERDKERDIDYEREEALFDLSQGYDGQSAATEEEQLNQRLEDNQLEPGEDLNDYQTRMSEFATLTKEMLLMRLEAADTQLKQQQEQHQAMLLGIIASLIEKMPGDVNLKNIAQSSFVAASTEISNEAGEANRVNFQKMFFNSFGK